VRDHNPPNSSPKSSTSRYIFQPFIASQIEEDALKRVGIVSAYLHTSENADIEPLENLKRVHEDYLTKLKEKLDRAKVEKDKTKDFDARKNKVSYEEMEEEIVKWVSKKEGKSYHLAQVEATYFIVIAFDKDQDMDENITRFFHEFRKHIRLHHVFRKLVRD